MYRILSIEDSPDEEATLRAHVERYMQESGIDLQLVWEKSAFDLSDSSMRYDLVFLDIDLPGINGMDAATEMRSHDPETPIVFVTNLAQYAIRGYEVDALDFVVKPVSYYDFKLRMDKAIRVLGRKAGRRLTIPVDGKVHVLNASDVAFIDVTDHDLAFHLSNGKTVTGRSSLAQAERDLEGTSFVRISKSCLVNMAFIRNIKGPDVTMATGDVVCLSRSRKRPAMEVIARYLGGSL